MLLFQMLQALGVDVSPTDCKVHLAVHNGKEHPLDLFLAGEFDTWQEWQRNRNFKRPHVVGLVALRERDKWLFTGLYDSDGCTDKDNNGLHRYRLSRRAETDSVAGRVVIEYHRTGRQSYPYAEGLADSLRVSEMRSQRLSIAGFPGYSSVTLTKRHLDIVVAQDEPNWRGALESVAGVYVIADTRSGKLYVGSATGAGGLWARWSEYSRSGHGGNKELISLLDERGAEHCTHFQFSILEIANVQTDEGAMVVREAYWKKVLLTREFGLNAN